MKANHVMARTEARRRARVAVGILTAAVALVVVPAPVSGAATDMTPPVGTFQLNRTSAYLHVEAEGDVLWVRPAGFVLTQTSLSDDTTAAADIVREVRADTGKPLTSWTTARHTFSYNRPGTYHPSVRLTDEAGNSSTVDLPAITVRQDLVNPKLAVTVPAHPARVSAWRHVVGTARDTQTGIDVVEVVMAQKRDGRWCVYDFAARKWRKGFPKLGTTLDRTHARPARVHPAADGTWRTAWVRNLRRGPLYVGVTATDGAFNYTRAPGIHRTLTRA